MYAVSVTVGIGAGSQWIILYTKFRAGMCKEVLYFGLVYFSEPTSHKYTNIN